MATTRVVLTHGCVVITVDGLAASFILFRFHCSAPEFCTGCLHVYLLAPVALSNTILRSVFCILVSASPVTTSRRLRHRTRADPSRVQCSLPPLLSPALHGLCIYSGLNVMHLDLLLLYYQE